MSILYNKTHLLSKRRYCVLQSGEKVHCHLKLKSPWYNVNTHVYIVLFTLSFDMCNEIVFYTFVGRSNRTISNSSYQYVWLLESSLCAHKSHAQTQPQRAPVRAQLATATFNMCFNRCLSVGAMALPPNTQTLPMCSLSLDWSLEECICSWSLWVPPTHCFIGILHLGSLNDHLL